MKPQGGARWLPAALLVAAVLLMTAGALLVRARAACSRGTAALARGSLDEAAVEYERTLGYRVPLDPAFGRSVDGLRAVAAGQERSGDIPGAWRTLERLQAAIRETASVLPRDERILEELEIEQRRLESRFGASAARARTPAGPGVLPARPLRSALVVLLLGSWVACTLALASRLGRGRPPRRLVAASVAAWAMWAVTLWLA